MPTKHRGPLLIDAGSAFEPDGYETVKQLASQQLPPAREFIHGAIIGVVELVDCLQDYDSGWAVNGTGACATRSPSIKSFRALESWACGAPSRVSLGEGATTLRPLRTRRYTPRRTPWSLRIRVHSPMTQRSDLALSSMGPLVPR